MTPEREISPGLGDDVFLVPTPKQPTGQEIFDAMSAEEQDAWIGAAAAEAIRKGEATLADFVERSSPGETPGFIRQKPVEDATKAFDPAEHPRGPGGRFAVKPGQQDSAVPEWEKRREYNAWVRSLSPEEQENLARVMYGKLWGELAAYLGEAGQPPPQLVFVDDAELGDAHGRVVGDQNCIRQVQLSRSSVLALALHGSGQQPTMELIAHEWRHVFQNSELLWAGSKEPYATAVSEEDARAFEGRAATVIRRNRERRREGKPILKPYVYKPGDISDNLGADPTKVEMPGCG